MHICQTFIYRSIYFCFSKIYMKSIIYTLLVIKKKQLFVVCSFFTSVSTFRMDRILVFSVFFLSF